MHEQDVVLGVLDRVQDLLGREADVDGVQHRAQHRDGEERLEVAVAVVVHDRHRVARLHPQRRQRAREAVHPLAQVRVGVASKVTVDDLLGRIVHDRVLEDATDGERVGCGGGARGELGHAALRNGPGW